MQSWQDNTPILNLAEKLNWPVIADINSGLRFSHDPTDRICTRYNLYLRSDQFVNAYLPDFVMQFGKTPISSALLKYLNRANACHVIIDPTPDRLDPSHRVSHRIECPATSFALELLKENVYASSELLGPFRNAEALAEEFTEAYFKSSAESPCEMSTVREVFTHSTTPRGIFIATSMPIRHADSFSGKSNSPLQICANRGVNGIDGTIASAVGFAAGIKLPTTLIIGDLAFLHDLNSLLLVKNSPHPITIVIINNDGGGIFSFLTVAEIGEKFEPFFGTPHGMKFQHLAAQFEIAYYEAGSTNDFVKCYKDSLYMKQSSIIEVAGNRKLNFDQHSQLWRDVVVALESKLNRG
jgi:2-succinyl-5-enolpyruvyl-6-hydroxy-3-cyclohexene-1-carboxylate synthase